VLDRTNFQPELTLRNAIRHVLACNEKTRQHSAEIVVRLYSLHNRVLKIEADVDVSMKEPVALPPVLADKVPRMKTAAENLKTLVPIDLMAGREDLHEAVRCLSRDLSDVESRGKTISPLSYMHNSLNACHPSQHVSRPLLCSCSPRHLYPRCRQPFHHCHGPAYTAGDSPPHPALHLTTPMGLDARTSRTA